MTHLIGRVIDILEKAIEDPATAGQARRTFLWPVYAAIFCVTAMVVAIAVALGDVNLDIRPLVRSINGWWGVFGFGGAVTLLAVVARALRHRRDRRRTEDTQPKPPRRRSRQDRTG